jgi:hypothetical protein
MGLFKGLFSIVEGVVSIASNTVGSIAGLSVFAIATSLNITETMVIKAKEAGCDTYEEIKEFWDLE